MIKTPHALVDKLRETVVELSWQIPSSWLILMVTEECFVQGAEGEKLPYLQLCILHAVITTC